MQVKEAISLDHGAHKSQTPKARVLGFMVSDLRLSGVVGFRGSGFGFSTIERDLRAEVTPRIPSKTLHASGSAPLKDAVS